MHIWTIEEWDKYLDSYENRRTGLRFRYEPYFPLRVPVYVKGKEYIKAMDGEHVVGTFFGPYDHSVEPYIKIATGDYPKIKKSWGRDNALASILVSIAHELTHYFQWITEPYSLLTG